MGMEKVYDICRIKDSAICWMQTAIGQGMECLDAKEVGEVADIIKDMCEAEKYVMESEYYKKVTEAMDSESEKPEWMESMGYTPRAGRNRMGRFTTGHMPTSYGYTPPYKPYIDQEPYINSYLNGVDKRWYTDSKDMHRPEMADGWYMKPEDGKYTSSHLDRMIDSMTEMWDDSDPELRKKIKKELTDLVAKMTV